MEKTTITSPSVASATPASPRFAVVDAIARMLSDAWLRNGRFDYTVMALAPVKGKTLAQLKAVRFWVGLGMEGQEMSLVEMVACWMLIADMARQREGEGWSCTFFVDLEPSDEWIIHTLAHIEIIE